MLPTADGPYARWIAWLELFGSGSADDPSPDLPNIDPDKLGGTITARITQHLGESVNARLGLWQQALQQDLNRSTSVDQIQRAFQAARHRSGPIRSLAGSQLLFQQLRESMTAEVNKAFASVLEGLEASARAQGPRGEQLLLAIKTSNIHQVALLDLGEETKAQRRSTMAAGGGGRSVLLG